MSRESSDQPLTQPWPVPPSSPVSAASPKDRIIKTDEDYGTIDGVAADGDASDIEDDKTDPYVDNDPGNRPNVLTVTKYPNDPKLEDSLVFEIPCTVCGRNIFYKVPKSKCFIHQNGTPCGLARLKSLCPNHPGIEFEPSLLNWIDSGARIISDEIKPSSDNVDFAPAGGGAADTGSEQGYVSGAEEPDNDIVQSDDDDQPEFKSPPFLTVQVNKIKYDAPEKKYSLEYYCPICDNYHHEIEIFKTAGFDPTSVAFVAGPPLVLDHICYCSPAKKPVTVKVSFKVWQFLGCKITEDPVVSFVACRSRKRCRLEEEELFPVRGC